MACEGSSTSYSFVMKANKEVVMFNNLLGHLEVSLYLEMEGLHCWYLCAQSREPLDH